MLKMVREEVVAIENSPHISTRQDALTALSKKLGLDDFGELLLNVPNTEFIKLNRLLPAMASDDVQDQWTGNHGIALLRQTLTFVRTLAYGYNSITGENLAGKKVLDYGCGYGRILRLIWYFTETTNVFGVDPWDRSIGICRDDGITQNIAQSSYLPETLPVGSARFDLSYAFSVFTHLSQRAAIAALSAVRSCTKTGGVFLITIRPVEYWPLGEQMYHMYNAAEYVASHENEGYAFFKHAGGNDDYGDASMTLDWLRINAIGWKVVAVDRSIDDAHQVYVFLRAI